MFLNREKKETFDATLTLKFFGSLKTVRMPSACSSMSISWISPGSMSSLLFWSERAALMAAREAWRAGVGRVEAMWRGKRGKQIEYADKWKARKGGRGRSADDDVLVVVNVVLPSRSRALLPSPVSNSAPTRPI
jgi:hypothetical protein